MRTALQLWDIVMHWCFIMLPESPIPLIVKEYSSNLSGLTRVELRA